jgi:hypothetical protein
VVFVLVVIPLVLIGAAAVASFVFVRLSTLRITSEGVEIRNYPQAPRLVPLADVAQFEPTPSVGNLSFIRPKTAALVLKDGKRVPVRTIASPDAGVGVDALNQRVESLRTK